MQLSEADHVLVTAAVVDAELATDGEIVAVVTARSDSYNDVVAHWSVVAMLAVLTLLAVRPEVVEKLYLELSGTWVAIVPTDKLFLIALVLLAITFLLVRALLTIRPLRLLLTPETTKARRVHRRALELFQAAIEGRTRAATGVLLYVSLDECRAEIIADGAIHSRVDQAVWGEAMAALVNALQDGRSGQGTADAVQRVGQILSEHFPHGQGDRNELPDRLIEL